MWSVLPGYLEKGSQEFNYLPDFLIGEEQNLHGRSNVREFGGIIASLAGYAIATSQISIN